MAKDKEVTEAEHVVELMKWVLDPEKEGFTKAKQIKIMDMAKAHEDAYNFLIERIESMIRDNIEKMRDYRRCPNDYELRAIQLLDMNLSSLRKFLIKCKGGK